MRVKDISSRPRKIGFKGLGAQAFLLLLLLILIQVISFYRALPINPACGRVQDLGHGAHILINCDSAVFMKDARDPKRLFNSQSVYQDRPMYALSDWVLANSVIALGVPDRHILVVGNSGSTTEYSEIFYLSYIFLNLLTLFMSVFLIFIWVRKNLIIQSRLASWLIIGNLIFLLAANELTKTFFWTPHSQMFNLLLPAYALFLQSEQAQLERRRNFYINILVIGFLMFFYSLLVILLYFLVVSKYKTIQLRILAAFIAVLPWLSFPVILSAFGGHYRSISISRYHEFIWVYLGAKQGTLLHDFKLNYISFIKTFPLIPLCLIFVGVLTLLKSKNPKEQPRIFKSTTLWFAIGYLFFYSIMGYYARRVTLGPIIFIELLCYTSFVKRGITFKGKNITIPFLFILLIFQIFCWFFTPGPMQ